MPRCHGAFDMPTFATGWKTYTTAAIAAAIGVYQGLIASGFHLPPIPDFVVWLLGAAGLYSVRSAISTDAAKTTEDVLSQVTAPTPPGPTSPAVIAASASKTMTAKANGTPYAAFIAAGWTDAELIAGGYLLAPVS